MSLSSRTGVPVDPPVGGVTQPTDPPEFAFTRGFGFICVPGECRQVIAYDMRPEPEIAAGFLEEVSGWLGALQCTGAPERVMFTLRALHDAACAWTDGRP